MHRRHKAIACAMVIHNECKHVALKSFSSIFPLLELCRACPLVSISSITIPVHHQVHFKAHLPPESPVCPFLNWLLRVHLTSTQSGTPAVGLRKLFLTGPQVTFRHTGVRKPQDYSTVIQDKRMPHTINSSLSHSLS